MNTSAATRPASGSDSGSRSGRVAAPGIQKSHLLGSLLETLDASRRITVFEVGAAVPDTVNFLSDYRCRMFFADLYEAPLVTGDQGATTEREWREGFTELLQFPDGTRFDLCLFWDFFNYLSKPALRAFNIALKPWLHAGTQGHAFAVLNTDAMLQSVRYGIRATDRLSVTARPGAALPSHPHPQVELDHLLSSFDVYRGWLLPDRRLEVLLKADLD